MLFRRNLLSWKSKYLYGLIMLSFVSVICAAFSMLGGDDFDIARREVLLRRIGHELLLQSGDSTSRVLPVKKIAENEYQISFENDLTFQPDSLVNTTRRLLAKDPLAGDYVVNVLNCGNASVAYGYAISKNKKDDIVACIGRKQPKACYMINVKFKPTGYKYSKNGYLLGSLLFLAFAGFVFLGMIKPQKSFPNDQGTRIFTFGPVLFKVQERQLIINKKTIDLTGTETRLLLIFALSPNETVERSRLQKEIWEDKVLLWGEVWICSYQNLEKNWNLIPISTLLLYAAKDISLKLPLKKNIQPMWLKLCISPKKNFKVIS